MKDEEHPQDISTEESDLKFERLLIDGIGAPLGSQVSPVPVPVVARVLSPSDVIIKICDLKGRVRYSHRRWGYRKPPGSPESCQWRQVGLAPILDPKQLISDYSSGVHEEFFTNGFVAAPFSYRAG
jgi:hypothetical protein